MPPNGQPEQPKPPGDPRMRQVWTQVRGFLDFVVNDASEELAAMTAANKWRIVGDILADASENLASPDPVLSVRRRLSNYAALAASDDVLAKTPEEAAFPGVTGTLRLRLPELAARSPRLRQFLGSAASAPGSVDQMADLLRARGIMFNLWARAYNVARIELGDYDRDKRRDWFGAYRLAQEILCEFSYRRDLGMESNLGTEPGPNGAPAEFMAYAEFEKAVLEGHREPRLVWEAKWEADLGRPCPLKGVEF